MTTSGGEAMIDRVSAYIDREIGLEAGSLVYVGLSGGADSTALLLILKELGYSLHALHCNFHLRGEESDRDQAFVEELCRQQDVPLSVRHFQTHDEARRRGVGIEMAARDLRYEWFREELHSSLPDSSLFTLHSSLHCAVAVAHHLDDQAETLLLNLLRGTGLRGMAGMRPRNGGIIRPLLCISREEILQYLEQRGQTYVTDSTNLEPCTVRNRLRLEVIPLLRSINPKADEHLCLACDNVRQSLPYYIKGIGTAFREHGITDESFPLPASSFLPGGESVTMHRTLLHEWLADKGFNGTQESEMLASTQTGRMWHSGTHTVLRDRDSLLLTATRGEAPEVKLQPVLHQEIVPCIGETGPDIAYFDADLITAPIEVRPVREGDAFVPFGMKGRKLVSDYLTDRKLNRLQKAEQFVATCDGNIIWLIGHRSDNRYRVTDSTRTILKVTCIHR